MEGFSTNELETLFHAMFAIAWADRSLQEEEQILLRAFVNACEVPSELSARIETWFKQPVSIEAIDWDCFGDEAKAFIYVAAYRVARVDNLITSEEEDMLARIAAFMHLPKETVEAIHSGRVLPDGHWLAGAFAPVPSGADLDARRSDAPA